MATTEFSKSKLADVLRKTDPKLFRFERSELGKRFRGGTGSGVDLQAEERARVEEARRRAQELARQKAEAEARKKAEALAKKQREAKKLDQRRRFSLLRQRQLAKARAIREGTSVSIALTRMAAESRRELKARADKQGVSIQVQQKREARALAKIKPSKVPVTVSQGVYEDLQARADAGNPQAIAQLSRVTHITTFEKGKRQKVKVPKRKPTSLFKRLPSPTGVPRTLAPGKAVTKKMIEKEIMLRTVTGKTFEALERKGFSKERIVNLLTLASINDKAIDSAPKLTSKQKSILKNLAKKERKVLVGGLKELEENPEGIIITAFSGGVAPKVLAKVGASKRVIKVLNKIPENVRKKGASAVSKSLIAGYLGVSGLRVVTAEKPAEQLGRIAVGEVVPFRAGTKFGVRGLMREELKKEIDTALKGMSKSRQQAFRDYMEQAEVFKKYEPEARNIKLNNIENLPSGDQGKKAQKVIRKFLKDKDIIVGGSVAQTGQIKVKRKLGDIDGYSDKESPKVLAKELARRLKKAGVERVSVLRGEARIGGMKSIEFHDVERIKQNIEQVIPVWASWKRYIVKTPEGIRIQRIGLQARRKLVAAFADPKRLQTGKYKKDLKDFKSISDKIFRNAVKKSKNAYFFKEKKLKEIEKIFGRKIPKTKVKKVKPIKKVKPTKKLKKPKVVKRKVAPTRKKVRVTGVGVRGVKKKISKPRVKPKRIVKKVRPSQRPIKKKVKPSQPPTKRKPRPSQPPKRPPKKPPGYPPPKRPPKKPPTPPRPPPRQPPSQPPTKPPKKPPTPPRPPQPPRPPKRPPKPPKKPPRIPKLKLKPKKIRKPKKAIPVFNVFGKSRGKFVKLNVKPLKENDALSRGAFAVDQTTAKTFKIVPAGKLKKPGALLKKERGYYSRTKTKLRQFRIKKGKKFQLTNKFIEKRKYGIDMKGEKKGLTIRRLIVARQKPKRKITPAQRKVMIKNLVKARRAKKKLKGGKK